MLMAVSFAPGFDRVVVSAVQYLARNFGLLTDSDIAEIARCGCLASLLESDELAASEDAVYDCIRYQQLVGR